MHLTKEWSTMSRARQRIEEGASKVSGLDVKIVRLAAMRVARFHGFGSSPELVAIEKLVYWARPKGLLENRTRNRIFGFNNPNPSPGSPNYGYETWIAVGSEIDAEKGVELHEFEGGLYGVTRCRGVESITPTWKALVQWLEESPYRYGSDPCLEELLGPLDAPLDELINGSVLDLYMPIAE